MFWFKEKKNGGKEHRVNKDVPPHTYTNLLYIEVLTAFEDAISPVTLKIFDKHLFPFTVNTAFLSSHAHTHARTNQYQFSAITFLHLNASSLIFSAQVYSEVVPDHASFDRPILCLLFIELTHRSKVVLSCHMNVNTALNLTNTEISNSDFWFPFSAVVLLLLFRTLFWRWTEMAIISFVVDNYYVVSSPDCSVANIWGYSFFNLEPVCESAHRGKFNMKFIETDNVCNMQPYEICGLVFECWHLSGLRKQIQKTFKKIHLY